MKKRTIAVDIDDVLSAYAEGFVSFSNKRWGTNLKPEDYSEHWEKIWEVDTKEQDLRATEIYASGLYKDLQHKIEAVDVLKQLKKHFNLVAVTSRRTIIDKETRDWLHKYFKDIFEEVHFAGIWDKLDIDSRKRVKFTKAEVCKEIGADYLIDDHPKHCIAASDAGIKTLLFGDYTWNRDVQLTGNMVRTKDWQAVKEYFDAQS